MSDPKVTIETFPNKRTKKHIDKLIQDIKDNGGTIPINGDFHLDLSYIDNPAIKLETLKGFCITIWPKDRDGSGVCVTFDPYDMKVCSGLVEVLEENGKREK